MKSLALPIFLLVIAGCGSSDCTAGPRSTTPSVTDETVDRIIARIYSDESDDRRRVLGETLAYNHDRRVQRIKAFLEGAGEATSATTVDAIVLRTGISVDGCGICCAPEPWAGASRLRAESTARASNSGSSAVRSLVEDLTRSYDEDRQLVQAAKGS